MVDQRHLADHVARADDFLQAPAVGAELDRALDHHVHRLAPVALAEDDVAWGELLDLGLVSEQLHPDAHRSPV